MKRAVGFLLCAALMFEARAARGDARSVAESIRGRVVKITAVFGGEAPETKHGFGFVAGERNGSLYIVTANHVVRSDIDDGPATATSVQFFTDQGIQHPAVLLETHRRQPLDLAVLRVPVPPASSGSAVALGAVPCDDGQAIGRGLPVAYVGRDGEWYVPTAAGAVNSLAPNAEFQIEVDFSRAVAVKEGTSGAPLVSERGLVGMIIQDTSTNIATVLATDAIGRAFSEWNHPWAAGVCPQPPPLLAESGIEVALRGGIGLPFGAFASNDSITLSEAISWTGLGAIEASYRFTKAISVGAMVHYADVVLSDDLCFYVGNRNDCVGSQTLVSLVGRYRHQVGKRFDVWAGLGGGYEWLSTHGSGGRLDHKGVEAARLEVGGDYIINSRLTLGPYASFSFARFGWGIDTKAGETTWSNFVPSGDPEPRWHSWLVFGVRLGIAVIR